MLDAASSADMAAAAGLSTSIPPSATGPAAVTVAAALPEANMRPPLGVDVTATTGGEGDTRSYHNKEQTVSGKGEKRKSRLAFGNADAIDGNADINNLEQERYLSLLGNVIGGGAS